MTSYDSEIILKLRILQTYCSTPWTGTPYHMQRTLSLFSSNVNKTAVAASSYSSMGV